MKLTSLHLVQRPVKCSCIQVTRVSIFNIMDQPHAASEVGHSCQVYVRQVGEKDGKITASNSEDVITVSSKGFSKVMPNMLCNRRMRQGDLLLVDGESQSSTCRYDLPAHASLSCRVPSRMLHMSIICICRPAHLGRNTVFVSEPDGILHSSGFGLAYRPGPRAWRAEGECG